MSDRKERQTEKQSGVGWEPKGIHTCISWSYPSNKVPSLSPHVPQAAQPCHCSFLQHKVLSSSVETKSMLQGYIHKTSLAMSCSACLLYTARTAQPFLPSQIHTSSTTSVYSSGTVDGSKGVACQTPVAPLLLLLWDFSVLSSPLAQGNIWMKDLSIFPVNKTY